MKSVLHKYIKSNVSNKFVNTSKWQITKKSNGLNYSMVNNAPQGFAEVSLKL